MPDPDPEIDNTNTPPIPDPAMEALKAEIEALKATITKQEPKKEPIKGDKPSAIELKYAERLKTEMGDKYNVKYDAMTIANRIDTMEAVIEALKGTKEPLHKDGEGKGGVGSNVPPTDNKPKTFLQLQNEKSFSDKLRNRGSYATIANKLYKEE